MSNCHSHLFEMHPNMIHSVYWWYLRSHPTTLPYSILRPITYSLHFRFTSSGCYINQNDEKTIQLACHAVISICNCRFCFLASVQMQTCNNKKRRCGCILLMEFIGHHDNQLRWYSFASHLAISMWANEHSFWLETHAQLMTIRVHTIILLSHTMVQRSEKLIFHSNVSLSLGRDDIKCHTSNNCQIRILMPELEFTMPHYSSIIRIPAHCFNLISTRVDVLFFFVEKSTF